MLTRRAIVAPVPGTTRDVLTHPVVWQDLGFELTDTGGMFGASADPLHELVVERGQRAHRMPPTSSSSSSTDAKGWCPATRRSPPRFGRSDVPVLLAVNKTDDRRARQGRSSCISWVSTRSSRSAPNMGMASASCSTRSSSGCRGAARAGAHARRRTTTPARRGRATDRRRARPRAKQPSPSSAGRTPASRRWSTDCCAKSG